MAALKSIAVLSLAAATAFPAGAALAARPDTRSMTCEQVRSLVRQRGAVVMTTGRHTYDRLVAHPAACAYPEIPWQTTVPARDTKACPVDHCVNRSIAWPSFDD